MRAKACLWGLLTCVCVVKYVVLLLGCLLVLLGADLILGLGVNVPGRCCPPRS